MNGFVEDVDFIIIDDDPFGVLITKRIITLSLPGATVITFSSWQPAIEYLGKVAAGPPRKKTSTVLLEIHMGFGSGWEFLEAFQKLDKKVQNCTRLSILSTIISDRDLLNANKFALINTVIEKPLSAEKLNTVLLAEKTR